MLAVVAAVAAAALVRPPRFAPVLSEVAIAGGPSTPPSLREGSAQGDKAGRGAKSRGRHNRTGPRSRSHVSHRRPRFRTPVHRLDINRVGVEQLEQIPGVSEELARRIVAFRSLVGPFESLDDLEDMNGISPGRLDSLGRYLVVR